MMALIPWMLTGCKGNGNTPQTDPAVSVYAFSPEGGADKSVSTLTSVIEEGRSVNAAFKTGGQIKRLTAGEGSYVAKGQVIGYLDDSDYKLQQSQLATQYDQVAAEVGRLEEMHRLKGVSDNDYEKALAGLEQLRLQLDLVNNQLSYTRLVAPVSGYVVERFMEEGEMVGSGTPVFKIVDTRGLEATVAMSAADYARRDKIVSCTGRSELTADTAIPLEIISFIPEGDSNALFKLRLRVPDSYRDRLLPGMNMAVDIVYGLPESKGLTRLPSRALFERGGKTMVWVINQTDSTLAAREVTLSGLSDGRYSMVSGLSGDELIVAVGVHHLSDGMKVRVIGSEEDIKQAAL